ncbi:hypothetical protein [Holdemania filiformis]|uniref:hypothetical protein n=1 Tax=Holdemania filiformis TaxID=61171 RepID=UPI0026751CB5|nr:hypothetical protein [Holdemania filiformis]
MTALPQRIIPQCGGQPAPGQERGPQPQNLNAVIVGVDDCGRMMQLLGAMPGDVFVANQLSTGSGAAGTKHQRKNKNDRTDPSEQSDETVYNRQSLEILRDFVIRHDLILVSIRRMKTSVTKQK